MKRTVLACLLVLGVVGATVPPSSTAHVSKPSASFTTHLADAGAASQANAAEFSPDAAELPSDAADFPPNATEFPAGGDRFPPGVNESGIIDPLSLVDAHQQALENTSYTVSTSATYRRPNGTLVAQEYTVVRVAPGGDSYSAVRTQTVANDTRWFGGERSDLAVWANETDAVVAEKPSGAETTYHWTSRSRAGLGPTSQWELLYATVGAGDAAVVGQVKRAGTTDRCHDGVHVELVFLLVENLLAVGPHLEDAAVARDQRYRVESFAVLLQERVLYVLCPVEHPAGDAVLDFDLCHVPSCVGTGPS